MNEPKIQALTRGKEPKRNICPNAKVQGRERSNHQPSLVAVNEAMRITWDSTVFLEKELKHNQSHKTLGSGHLLTQAVSRSEYHQGREGEKV